jgi:GT2 family glycosyltransferase
MKHMAGSLDHEAGGPNTNADEKYGYENKTPKVTVVVVNHNGGDYLGRCLCALEAQQLVPPEIIVVDNASTDGSIDGITARHPRVKVLKLQENLGFARANNLAIRTSVDSEWVVLLNPDAFPEPTWFEALLRGARANPEFSFFACHMLKANDPSRVDGQGDAYHVSGRAWRQQEGAWLAEFTEHQPEEVFSSCAAAAMYRRDYFLEIGGFDEDFFCYFEDVDLGFQLRLLGHRCLYVPEAVVHHVGSAITGKHSEFSLYHGHRNLVWTYVKNMPWPLFWLYLPQHILLNIISVLWFTLRGQGRILCKAKWDALRDLPRVWRQRKSIQSRRRVTSWELRRLMSKGLLRPYLLRRR